MKLNTVVVMALFAMSVQAQKIKTNVHASPKPKLVVGIVVDQMRWDYINRFKPFFTSQNGFLRFINEGASCDQTLIPYVPTVTACGHTCIYTGSVPAIHGIVGNNWFDNVKQKSVYCVDDASVQTVGSSNNAAGQMSPLNVWTNTIGDELKLASNFQSKVIGISIKDRGAIIPAGHAADAAYWYDSKTGNFITSTYYTKQLPSWVNDYNGLHRVDSLYAKGWKLSLPISIYSNNCDEDENSYESTPFGKDAKHFPYDFSPFIGKDFSKISTTPWGNTLVIEMAQKAIEMEKLGADTIPDLLAVSFSSPDYIGHSFGPNSWETLDGYIKLDQQLSAFFSYLDRQVGKGQYTVFLTADHAIAPIQAFAKKHHIPSENYDDGAVKTDINTALAAAGIPSKIINQVSEYNVYYNHYIMDSLKISNTQLTQIIQNTLEKKSNVLQVVVNKEAASAPLPTSFRERIVNGYTPQRSGDLMVVTKSGVIDGYSTGASHGVIYNYDAHIPFLLYGAGIQQVVVNKPTYMTDIAPTISTLLGIQMPSGSIGKPVIEVLK